MRFNELDEPKIGDILEVEIGDEIVETVIVGITESGDYLCETDSDTGMSLLESRSDWDSNMPGYKGDYGGAENWGRRNREDDEHHEIDRQREQQLAQYNQTGNFWLKYKDSGKHINDQPYTGKAAAIEAAHMMIRSNPEVKGNLLITAYGPGESQGVGEGSVDEGWKEKLGAAALAGTMALGANARVMPGDDANINRLTGKPIATQQTTNTVQKKLQRVIAKNIYKKQQTQSALVDL